jgi:hypothetical protein
MVMGGALNLRVDPLVPAQAENQSWKGWIPAYAGMSGEWVGTRE